VFGFTVECDDPVWSAEERLLIRLVDELHDTSAISDGFWRELAAAFGVEQIFELIALVGFYRALRRAAPVGLTRTASRSAGDADLA